jgi:hypothetical protein
VTITFNEDEFRIIEYVLLGFNNNFKYYPLEEVIITFQENGSYQMDTELIFEPPKFNKKSLHHIFNASNAVLEKLKKDIPLIPSEKKDVRNLPATYLICFLNDFPEAKIKLFESKPFLRKLGNDVYDSYKESVRILRKVKYS